MGTFAVNRSASKLFRRSGLLQWGCRRVVHWALLCRIARQVSLKRSQFYGEQEERRRRDWMQHHGIYMAPVEIAKALLNRLTVIEE